MITLLGKKMLLESAVLPPADYPDEADVKNGVEYNDDKTGSYVPSGRFSG